MLAKPFQHVVILLFFLLLSPLFPEAQTPVTLKEALETARNNYASIKAKTNYAAASRVNAGFARSEYLPNLNFAGQWDYGTVNGQIGPAYGFGGLGVASSGLPAPSQNWDAAFGAIYLTNVNWDFFAFGRAREKIRTADAAADRDEKELEQEVFQHSIKVTAAYLNLLVARRLRESYEKNLERAEAIGTVVRTRALNGLIPGIDSSQALAEISGARIAITRALDFEQEQNNLLAQLMGVAPQEFVPDTVLIHKLPAVARKPSGDEVGAHPLLQFYRSRIAVSQQQSRYLKTFYYPAFSLVGVFQTRGSGFGDTYASDRTDYTHDIWRGFQPVRSNFLFGLGVTWNVTQPLRYSHQVKSQDLVSLALQEEYNLADQQIRAQLDLADTRMTNALRNYEEAPIQVKAASDAFLQKSVLYRNGLVNLVDLNQAMYALVRAETDLDIARNNLWQALLLRAAASGDYSIFENEL